MSSEDNLKNMETFNEGNKPASDTGEMLSPTDINKTADLKTSSTAPRVPEKYDNNTGVAIKNRENESFNSLLAYDSDSDSSSSSSSSEIMKLNLKWKARDQPEDSDDSSSSDKSEDSESDSSESEDEQCLSVPSPHQANKGAIKKEPISKFKNEMSFEHLPPVPDISTLSINVENENIVLMGEIVGIIDSLVTVSAIPNTAAYDLDTLLFLDNGKRPLGFIFDVLGPVTSPLYAIRYNSADEIKKLNIEVGLKVYSAQNSKHTQYVFLQDLLKIKGSDASWLHDRECPQEFAEFSDDEDEFPRSGRFKVKPHHKRGRSGDNYKEFENTMNKRNILNTKFNKCLDLCRQKRYEKSISRYQIDTSLPPDFNPAVPPPNIMSAATITSQDASQLSIDTRPIVINNNASSWASSFCTNNFAANLSTNGGGNYFMNNAGGNYPGPSYK